jgi:hypothetical protein
MLIFLFQIEYGLDIEPLLIGTSTFIFLTLEENFEAFHIDFGADRLLVVHVLGLFISMTRLHS